MAQVELYDTTLRDGAQYEGISLSVEDKLAITRKLDKLGVHYIEGGWPGSNPRDAEFFERTKGLRLENATLAAFGSTRRASISAAEDANILALLDAETPVVTLVGKSWDLHVTRVLETSLEENLAMISDSVAFLKDKGRRVFFDAEHFFDGYRANAEYALLTVKAAAQAGSECVILCDTNGGSLPDEISEIVETVSHQVDVALGIHTHNDAEMAVAGALAAVRAGATQVQGTVNGYGERCGNANLLSVIANLKLKMGVDCVSDEQLGSLTEVSRFVSEVANMPPVSSQPYVGASAFAHKGGLHVSAVAKVEHSYQHVPPQSVGNDKRVLVSDLSGRSNILWKVHELGLDMKLTEAQARALLEQVKALESKGFQYEGAEASFELLVRRAQPGYAPPFALVDFVTMVEKRMGKPQELGARGWELGNSLSTPASSPQLIAPGDICSQVMLKVSVGGEVMHTAADGNGPVNALDNALRKALLQFYPTLTAVRLTDYKVRVVDQGTGTGAVVRVLIESTDGRRTWNTVGSSENIIEASWLALSDSMEYWLAREL
jgi:2-isopropylmalate synthase